MKTDDLKTVDVIMSILKEQACKGIMITDGQGTILRAEEGFFSNMFTGGRTEFIGKSIFDLEKQLVFSPSITVKILKEKKHITMAHVVNGKHTIIGEGFPVRDNNNEIKWVVTFTRDKNENMKMVQLYDDILDRIKDTQANNDSVIEDFFTFNTQFKETLKGVKKMAPYETIMLITGETGTGKSLLAKKIHELSRRKGEFIEINCGAIAEPLIDSELFGYERGAFTGAEKEGKIGLVEAAQNGTLFLDEISELPFSSQVKLLDVLQEKKIRRVGATKSIDVDCRIIAATNKNLQEAVEKKKFREDLYYRLSLALFDIPPLRERYEDIIPLAKSILHKFCEQYEEEYFFTYEVLSIFLSYDWPGNVRELENTIHRMILVADDSLLHKNLLPYQILKYQNDKYDNMISFEENEATLKEMLDNYEGTIIRNAYKQYGSSVKVAKALGIAQTSASRKIRKYVEKEGDIVEK